MHPLIESYRAQILAIAAKHDIRNVRVFGELLMDMQDLLQRRVDVVTERALHPALRKHVLKEALPL